jgi:glycosyltransferase involved in cell wall biosynthesis
MGLLRVGVDAHVLDGRYQGSRTWLLEILRRAPSLAPEISFVIYSADPENTASLLGSAPVEHRVLQPGGPVKRNLLTWPRLIRNDDLALLVTQYFCSPRVAQRQVPVIHDVLFETHPEFFPFRYRWRNRLLVSWSARHARLVMTVSAYSRDQIARVYGRDPATIAIVNNGVDAASFASGEATAATRSVTGGPGYGLFVGRLEPRKNLRLALAALRLLPDPAARLVVVGRNDFEDPVVLAELADEPRAIHLVDVSDEMLRALYRDASALVYPSLGEGWGIPVLESLAAGTPVIASDVTAIPEAGGDTCHYFSPTSPDAAERLADLFGAALAGRLEFDAQSAAAHVRSFSWDHSAEQFVAGIRAAIAPDPRIRTRGRTDETKP